MNEIQGDLLRGVLKLPANPSTNPAAEAEAETEANDNDNKRSRPGRKK